MLKKSSFLEINALNQGENLGFNILVLRKNVFYDKA